MNKSILKFALLGLLAVAVAGTPVVLHAQSTNAPAKRRNTTIPFHGKLVAVDNTAKTISIGKETIQITSETKITKNAKAAVLEDAAVGDDVGGTYRKDAEGKLNAVSLRIGPKVTTDSGSKTNKP
jgi:hypothetical protein